MSSRIALYHPTGGVEARHNPFGKDVANVELFRAIVRHGSFDHVDFLTGVDISVQTLSDGLLHGAAARPKVGVANILDQAPAVEAGALLRGHPDLADMAWLRRSAGLDQAYSLLGVVHTIAPPAMRQIISTALISPVQPWDAVICTSPSVQRAMGAMFDEWADYLADRFGGKTGPKPHLPLLPLGVEAAILEALADRPGVRKSTRAELGIEDNDILVLWVGRLSFFEKAFPQPMFRALEEAARDTGARLHFVMVGWFPDEARDRKLYEEAAQACAPSLAVHFLDGNDKARLGAMWAASDIFLSLVDNIQETFGITPLEAMAAGLPVVVSDWDGYRSTVRDGEEGFLIRTLGGPFGAGRSLINQHLSGSLSYQTYVGVVAQHTAVHVGDAAQRLASLIRSPTLRANMGAAGRKRVRAMFDWPVVVGQLEALLGELGEIRRTATTGLVKHRFNPVKKDPFESFAGFATEILRTTTRLSLAPGASAGDLEAREPLGLDEFGAAWRATREECSAVLGVLFERGELSVGEILQGVAAARHQVVALGLCWMCKLGLLDWRAGTQRMGSDAAGVASSMSQTLERQEGSVAGSAPSTANLMDEFRIAAAHLRRGDLEAAEAQWRAIIARAPLSAEAHLNLGQVLKDRGRLDESEAAFQKSLELKPYAVAYYHLGTIYHLAQRIDEAESALQAALRLDSSYHPARLSLGYLYLGLGDFERGWTYYEARKDVPNQGVMRLDLPEWSGESLIGKSLLIWPEQGFGDQIQFARYAPLLQAQGADVTLVCAPDLVDLFAGLGVRVEALATSMTMPPFDYWTLPMSIPRWLSSSTIPAAPYLVAPDDRRAKWAGYASKGGIGLVWRGSPSHKNDVHRSLPSRDVFQPLADLGCPLIDLQVPLGDFADTAAIIEQLDLVISVDTAVAHLAGALGKPCWVMLPAIRTDWRWQRNRVDSPWYPSVRLFRQTASGDWSSVIDEIVRAFRQEGLATEATSSRRPAKPAHG
ncbi:MAG: glycosyltransferase [Phenylobacterium sp.]|uniref:glycosyltransferase n=1 Tax=Phenylobacterium sp. TaxID=1871053 RepID=UPI00273249B2|nr:glycosyltransferase [Phenylobacterium sp.]MDP3749247.1 glycosyltransferase [Phenylobacterium sp.]